jgi:predicted alpha/beta hydrolase family esterase
MVPLITKNNLVLPIIVGGLFTAVLWPSPLQSYQQASLSQDLTLSTRGFFNLKTGATTGLGQTHSAAVPDFQLNQQSCPTNLAIYAHGVWAKEDEAKEQYGRVKDSYQLALRELGQTMQPMPLILYTWDSDTIQDLRGVGWNIAKSIANDNGRFLANSIININNDCQSQTGIHIIAHSLGARAVLSALHELGTTNLEIKSVHLMGAAADDEKVSKNPSDADNSSPSDNGIVYGMDIENHVTVFHNLFSPEDNYLQSGRTPSYYPVYENDLALGHMGADPTIVDLPRNYREENVQNELPEDQTIDFTDADGNDECDLNDRFLGYTWIPFPPFFTAFWGCGIDGVGDNHRGYMGFRDHSSDRIADNGVMDIVAQHWSTS